MPVMLHAVQLAPLLIPAAKTTTVPMMAFHRRLHGDQEQWMVLVPGIYDGSTRSGSHGRSKEQKEACGGKEE